MFMQNSSLFLYQVDQIRKLENFAVEKLEISVDNLMESAGKSGFQVLRKEWPKAKNITVVCGKGNNAGDGYVVARLAKKAKLKVKILQLAPYSDLRGAAKKAAAKCQKLKIPTKEFAKKELEGGDVIVDAIFGIGIKGDLKPKFKNVIKAINSYKSPVLAIDLPSGIDAYTGKVLGAAIKADTTVTFIANKIGLFVGDAREYTGKIICADLNLPEKIFKQVKPYAQLLNLKEEIKPLKPRRRNAHKGDFGHVLVIGGDYGMGGAVLMAATAAARVGAGLVSVATRNEHITEINFKRPEIMAHEVNSAKQLKPLLDKATVILIGPGLGQTAWGKKLFNTTLKSKKPLIVDADALNLLAKNPQSNSNWILTPHPGEAARLLKGVKYQRIETIKKLVKKYNGVVVLKGSGTLIAADKEMMRICDAGNPGMASGGMGDILSGIIAGLVAQKLTLFEAAKLGVLVHALAGDLVATKNGKLGMLATDLLIEARKILNDKGELCF